MTTQKEQVEIQVNANTRQAQTNLKKASGEVSALGKQVKSLALPLLGGYLGMQAMASGAAQTAIAIHSNRREFVLLKDALTRLSLTVFGELFNDLAPAAEAAAEALNEVNKNMANDVTFRDQYIKQMQTLGYDIETIEENLAKMDQELVNSNDTWAAWRRGWSDWSVDTSTDIVKTFASVRKAIREAFTGSAGKLEFDAQGEPLMVGATKGLFSPIIDAWNGVWAEVSGFDFAGLWEDIKGRMETFKTRILAIVSAIKTGAGDLIHGVWNAVIDEFRTAINQLISIYNFKVPDIFKGKFGLPEYIDFVNKDIISEMERNARLGRGSYGGFRQQEGDLYHHTVVMVGDQTVADVVNKVQWDDDTRGELVREAIAAFGPQDALSAQERAQRNPMLNIRQMPTTPTERSRFRVQGLGPEPE